MDKHFLLASLVGEKNARCLLADHGGRLRDIVLSAAEPSCAYSHPGLIKIRAARQLVQEALLEELGELAVMGSPAQVRDYLRLALEGRAYEVFLVLYLDAQHHVLAAEELFRGTLTQTSVYPREVVRAALARNAAALILAHCHPSGIAEPSQADLQLTRVLSQALALVDIKVLDHFIVGAGPGQVMSFSEKGLL